MLFIAVLFITLSFNYKTIDMSSIYTALELCNQLCQNLSDNIHDIAMGLVIWGSVFSHHVAM